MTIYQIVRRHFKEWPTYWFSSRDIADELGLNQSSVRRAINTLYDERFIRGDFDGRVEVFTHA